MQALNDTGLWVADFESELPGFSADHRVVICDPLSPPVTARRSSPSGGFRTTSTTGSSLPSSPRRSPPPWPARETDRSGLVGSPLQGLRGTLRPMKTRAALLFTLALWAVLRRSFRRGREMDAASRCWSTIRSGCASWASRSRRRSCGAARARACSRARSRSTGCSAGFISADGLMITNHHCAFGDPAAALDAGARPDHRRLPRPHAGRGAAGAGDPRHHPPPHHGRHRRGRGRGARPAPTTSRATAPSSASRRRWSPRARSSRAPPLPGGGVRRRRAATC